MNQQLRAPFAVLVQNFHNVNDLPAQLQVDNAKEILKNGNSPHRKDFLFSASDCSEETWETHYEKEYWE
jgi:hypothetical protein